MAGWEGAQLNACRVQPVADPNRTNGTFVTRVASVLPS